MEQPGGRHRLILGFDAGCLTCSEVAKRIGERVGNQLEVRSLYDPQVERWRKEVFGEAAPWAPTLVEVDGVRKVRAWTGARMAIHLGRALGPLASWRVMQVLGGANADLRLTDSVSAKVVSGLTRGQFLKAVGGAAVAISILGGTGKLPSAAAASTSVRYEEIFGEELIKVARAVTRHKDVINVTSETWRKKVRSGSVIHSEIVGNETNSSVVIEAIDLYDGLISSANGRPVFSGELAIIKAARHILSDGNSMLAVSFAMPKNNQLVVYYEYEKPTFLPKDQVKTKAEALLYKVGDDSAVLKKASSNDQLQTLQQGSTRLSCGNDRHCDHACDIAYGYSPCIRVRSLGCIAYQCRACALTCWGGALLCAACALVICSWGVIRECCIKGYGCKRCGLCK